MVFLHQDVCLSRTGNEFDALHWHTLCAVCGVEFPFRTILGTASTVTKRCEIHRNAGKLPPVPDPLPIYMVDPVTRSISEIPHPKNCEATNEPA